MNNMIDRHNSSGDGAVSASLHPTLLEQAEIACGKTVEAPGFALLSAEEAQHMLHELRVHQIELEMQNEELRRTQVELEAARASYFDLYDLAPSGYCTLSEQGLILQSNLAAALLLGMARGALVRQPISRFILKADQDIYYLCRKQLMESGESGTCELRMLNNGALVWVRLAITAARDNNGVPVLRMALTDITQSKLAAVAVQESEARYRALSNILQAKNVELEKTQSIADKANRAKSDFLSNMSHELRTPLSAILGFAQLLESGNPAPTPTQKQSLKQILKAGWYLLELINEILDLAQVESGKLSVMMEPLSLSKVIHECQNMVEPQAQKREIRMTSCPLEVPYYVNADPTRLKQAIINLLSNAIKYNRHGGTVEVKCIEVIPERRIRVCIKDTGEGLPAEKLSQLFQPFNRLGQESNSVQGTGIGLVMCKRLVELMGGAIGVESTPGTGSLFWIELNLTDSPPQKNPAVLQPAAIPPVHTGALVCSVLYIEDNSANLMLVEDLISRRPGLRMLSALDAINGIEIARIYRPDVILMDINLPGMSGIEALAILSVDPATAHIPVVALSANAMPRDIGTALQAGFFNYLTKPIRVGELMDALDAAVKFSQTQFLTASQTKV